MRLCENFHVWKLRGLLIVTGRFVHSPMWTFSDAVPSEGFTTWKFVWGERVGVFVF